MAWKTTKQTGTRHSETCTKAFNRFDATCHRCQELIAGQPARKGWSNDKQAQEQRTIAAIRSHDFTACMNKHVVCTCFDA